MSTQHEYPQENTMTPSGEDPQDTLMPQVDGNRPIDRSDLMVQYVLPIDGNRPVVSDGVRVCDTHRSRRHSSNRG